MTACRFESNINNFYLYDIDTIKDNTLSYSYKILQDKIVQYLHVYANEIWNGQQQFIENK